MFTPFLHVKFNCARIFICLLESRNHRLASDHRENSVCFLFDVLLFERLLQLVKILLAIISILQFVLHVNVRTLSLRGMFASAVRPVERSPWRICEDDSGRMARKHTFTYELLKYWFKIAILIYVQ